MALALQDQAHMEMGDRAMDWEELESGLEDPLMVPIMLVQDSDLEVLPLELEVQAL